MGRFSDEAEEAVTQWVDSVMKHRWDDLVGGFSDEAGKAVT